MKKITTAMLSAISIIYTLWYMSYGVPYKNSGALSKIGLVHHGLFVIWGLLTVVALSYNITIAYKRYTRYKFYIPLLIVAIIGMALTLGFDFRYNTVGYYFHCAGSLLFSVIMGATIFLVFALNYKKAMIFKVFTIATAVILFLDFLLLLAYKETGLIEVIPIFAGYIMLGMVNLRRDKVEAIK